MDNLMNTIGLVNKQKELTVRVITFQTRDILSMIVKNGFVQSTDSLNGNIPKRLSRNISDKSYFMVDNKDIIVCNKGENLSNKVNLREHAIKVIYPFNAYMNHRCLACGDGLHPMSIQTVYKLASHFIAGMGFEGRDIIELDVPESQIISTEDANDYTSVAIPKIEKEWIVSVLRYDRQITEPVYGELALKYVNEVINRNTYTMCCSSDIILSGHGKADLLEFAKNPAMLRGIEKADIQKSYVQSDIFNLFIKFLYSKESDVPLKEVKDTAVYGNYPDEFPLELIDEFNNTLELLSYDNGVFIYPKGTNYRMRLNLMKYIKSM